MQSCRYYYFQFKRVSLELDAMGDEDAEAVEQLRLDSTKVTEFKDELVKRGLKKTMSYEQAMILVDNLRDEKQFKNVKSLYNVKLWSKLWWDKFRDEIKEIELIEVEDSEDEDSENEDFSLYVGEESAFSKDENGKIFKMFEWKKKNPNGSFAKMARIFSPVFEDRVQVNF